MLIDRSEYSSILNIRRCSRAYCDTNHYLVVAKFRERSVVSKQATQRFDGEIFNLRKLNESEVRKQYQNDITNRFAALENLSDDKNINMAWENIKENIKTTAKKSRSARTEAA